MILGAEYGVAMTINLLLRDREERRGVKDLTFCPCIG